MLGVHESSVKRWCNANELDYWLTPGGHRRIPIHALVTFANAQGIDLYLCNFGEDAGEVWGIMEQLKQKADFKDLTTLFFRWIYAGEIERTTHLIGYLISSGHKTGVVFDSLIGPVMKQVGIHYFEGTLSIGDEHRMTQVMRDILVTVSTTGILKPQQSSDAPRVAVVGCARGEVHELGALMVRVLLESAGWQVIYLGLNVPTEEFAHQQIKHGASMVCISLMPPMGAPEAYAMIRLMNRIYDEALPYRLVLGGSALREAQDLDTLNTRMLDVQLFNRMMPFQQWVEAIETGVRQVV